MENLFKFELYKLTKQKRILYMLLSVLIFQLLMAIFIKYNPDFMSYEKGIQYSFLSPILVNINIIYLACNMFAEDFEYLTLIPIRNKFPNFSRITLVKLLVIFVMHIMLLFIVSCFTMIISLVLLRYEISFKIFTNVLLYNFVMIIPVSTIIILAAIVILITKKERTGLILGLFIYMFYGFGAGFNFLIISKLPIFKYGIINLLNLPNQLFEPEYIELTRLSSSSMILVSLLYLIIEGIILFRCTKSVEV